MAEQSKAKTGGKVMLGCGGLLLLLALSVTLFCAYHVFLDPRGAISAREAMPGFLAGSFFVFISIVVLLVGGVLASYKPAAAASAPAPAVAADGSSIAPPAAAVAAAKPFPAHFLVGCGTLFVALMSCGSCGSSTYYFDKANTYDRWADQDSRSSYYSSYRSILGGAYYRAKASRYRTYGGVAIGFGVFLLLLTAGAGFGTARLAKSYRDKTKPPPA